VRSTTRESTTNFSLGDTMTEHNATWSEELYYGEVDDEIDEEDPDPRGHTSEKSGYWDYRED